MQQHEVVGLIDLLDLLIEKTNGEETVAISDMRDVVARRSYGPLIFLPALVVASPLGAIPMMPAFVGLLLFGVSIQLATGKRSPWLPKRIASRSVPRPRFMQVARQLRPWLNRFDRMLAPRMSFLFDWPFSAAIGAVCSVLALSMLPIGLIPGAVFVPAFGLCLFGAALLARDGLVLTAGATFVSAGGWLIWFLVS